VIRSEVRNSGELVPQTGSASARTGWGGISPRKGGSPAFGQPTQSTASPILPTSFNILISPWTIYLGFVHQLLRKILTIFDTWKPEAGEDKVAQAQWRPRGLSQHP
jgi:hypothetical protein